MKFESEQLRIFRDLSQDWNPLHSDPDYSKRTQFGQPVVFGMAAVLFALGQWAKGRRFRLLSIHGEFLKPLFQGINYRLEAAESSTAEHQEVVLSVLKGTVLQSKIVFSWIDRQAKDGSSFATFRADRQANALNSTGYIMDRFPYSPDFEALRCFEQAFQFRPDQIPSSQLATLLWASYFTGMVFPGRQAFFSSFDIKFRLSIVLPTHTPFQMTKIEGVFDDRVNRTVTTAEGTGIESLTITAFNRPEPVTDSMDEIAARIKGRRDWAEKNVFVTGGSRGFGAALVKGLTLQGANVGFNYLSSEGNAVEVDREISHYGGNSWSIRADLGDDTDCRRIKEHLTKEFSSLDLLIHNASPVIGAKSFTEQTPDELIEFVSYSTNLISRLTFYSISIMKPGGLMMLISSAYAKHPEPQFAHYAAAKGAAEGLMRGLAKEYRKLRFLVVRPPRMLTDQTNDVAFPRKPSQSTSEVLGNLFDHLQLLSWDKNFQEVDL